MNPSQRAQYVHGLEVELASLTRLPEERQNPRRIREVREELERYSSKPSNPPVETAAPAVTSEAQRRRRAPRTK